MTNKEYYIKSLELQKLIEQLKDEKSKARYRAEELRQEMELELAQSRAFDLAIDKAELLLKQQSKNETEAAIA